VAASISAFTSGVVMGCTPLRRMLRVSPFLST
jgi:hypothetical protein